MVIVFFAHTVRTQNIVLEDDTRAREHRRGHRPAVVVDVQLRPRRPGRVRRRRPLRRRVPLRLLRPRRRHRRLHPRAVAAGRRDDAVQPAQPRRDPRLRRPELPHEDGRRPGPGQPLRHQADPDRRLRRASATSSAASTTRGCCSRSTWSAVRTTRPHLQDLEDAGLTLRPPAARRRGGLHAGGPRRRNRGGIAMTATASHPTTVVGNRAAAGPAGRPGPDDDRPQGDRQPLPRHVVLLVPHRRPDGDADALRAGLPRPAGRQRRALQPAVHDARHDHAAALRDAAVLRLRQRDHAAADRVAGRRVPAAEHVQLLALPDRRPDRRLRAS